MILYMCKEKRCSAALQNEYKFDGRTNNRSISELTNFGEYAHSEIRFLFIK